MIPIISRKEAKARGLQHFFTGKPCKRGHIDERFTSSSDCMTCNRERVVARLKNPEKRKNDRQKKSDEEWKVYRRENKRRARANNPEKYRGINKRSDQKRGVNKTKKAYKKDKEGGSRIYFRQAGGPTGPVKIGITTTLRFRKKKAQTDNHEPLTDIRVISGNKLVEDELHDIFHYLRLPPLPGQKERRKEWFDFTPEMLTVWKDAK